jgi:hypothetical protein
MELLPTDGIRASLFRQAFPPILQLRLSNSLIQI